MAKRMQMVEKVYVDQRSSVTLDAVEATVDDHGRILSILATDGCRYRFRYPSLTVTQEGRSIRDGAIPMLVQLVVDLLMEGYQGGSNEESWRTAWAECAYRVAHGDPYSEDMVITLHRGEPQAGTGSQKP